MPMENDLISLQKNFVMRTDFLSLLVLLSLVVQAQSKPYSLLIKGGHVIDPKNNINTVMDVAIADGKIALLATNIDAASSTHVVDARGMYVTPGLIDIHGHVFAGTEPDHA